MSNHSSIVDELWNSWVRYRLALLGQSSSNKTMRVSDDSIQIVSFYGTTSAKRLYIKVCTRHKFLWWRRSKQILLFTTWMQNYLDVNGSYSERRFEINYIDPSKAQELTAAVFLLKTKADAIEDNLGAADAFDDL